MSILHQYFHEFVAQPTDFAPIQLEIEHADGIYLYDNQGKKYIDFISGIAVSNIGHRNKQVVDAVKAQIDKYMHVMVYGEYVQAPQVLLAKALAEHLPENLNCTFFTNSGSEAIEGAIKLAKLHTKRTEIVAFTNSYHGSTLGAISIVGQEIYKRPFRPLIPDVKTLEYNNISQIQEITEKTACVVFEPIQAASGIHVPTPQYFAALRKRCTDTGAMLIFDEMQTGFGRTGYLFALHSPEMCIPDVLCMGKAMGGGMPIAAFVSSKEIMNSLNNGHPLIGHASTFGGHPVMCAAALANLQVIDNENIVKDVNFKGEFLRTKLKHKKIKEIRGRGLMLAIDLGDANLVEQTVTNAIHNGLVINWFLYNNESLHLVPPLIITEQEMENASDILLKSIA